MSLADAANDHFILTQLSSLVIGRMDPIISPNAISGHVHNVQGGSAFSRKPIPLSSPNLL